MRRLSLILALYFLITACGSGADSDTTTSTAAVPETTVNPATTSTTPPNTTAEPTWTSDSTWDMCLVTAPDGRKYEWLNHETWMSLERQRREITKSLIADGGGATTASTVPEKTDDHAALIDDFIDARCDLIVTIGAEMGEATTARARQHPDINFIGIDQYHDQYFPNLAGLVFPEDHAGFLVGTLAASVTQTGIVAVILDSTTEPSSAAYGSGFMSGVSQIDPDIEVLTIVHAGNEGEPDAGWGVTAASQALDDGADVVFGPGSESGSGVLVEVAGTGFDARNEALCIGAEVDDWLSLIKARRCLLTSVLKLPNEFHDMYWAPGRPVIIKQFQDALEVPTEYEKESGHSTLALITQEFFLGGTPSGSHVGPVGLGNYNRWGAHKTGVPNRTFWASDDFKLMLANLSSALWTGEIQVPTAPVVETTVTSTTSSATEEQTNSESEEWETEIGNQIASLAVSDDLAPVSYDRDDWGSSWGDHDGDCISTRHEVLILESLEPVELSSDGCRVMSGYWYGAFAGIYTSDPSSFDIDHFVPLANAHASGGWVWNTSTKNAFYNDLADPQHLIAVSASENRSKGARGPDEWKPSDISYWCQYAVSWVEIKSRWALTVTTAEQEALLLMIESCDGPPNMEGDFSPPAVTVVSTTTVPVVTTTTAGSTSTSTVPPNPGNSKNCGDFSTWLEAQEWFDTYFPYYGDVGRLDGNNDGVACESLPGAP